MGKELLRCRRCGHEKRVDLSGATNAELQHCGFVMRLVDESPEGESPAASAES